MTWGLNGWPDQTSMDLDGPGQTRTDLDGPG